MNKLGYKICEDLLKYDKEYWCRAYFRDDSKCEVIENNMCETFNSWIIGPRHKMILEENKSLSTRYKVMWNAEHGFEVDEGVYRFIVDFRTMPCTCRSWMLRGIPYQHAVCAFYDREMDPDDYVTHWYRKETFLKSYQYFIQPIPNMKMWSDSTNPSIEPPEPKLMPGRPKRCRR
ncbi:uncharacterized protein LOC107769828 [Nicotiana tabacum]|uniref:uncharacterized protein LOC107769828 n=1 Tax=Nicotiana tabacum TaxID=4097 RepID=UPI003F4E46F3